MANQTQILDELIPQYAQNKAEFDSYKKICEKENAQIKAIMATLPDNVYEAGGYRATYSIQHKDKMDEEVLLSLFSSVAEFVSVADRYNIVKSKPYIDFDALEKAIYDNALSKEQIVELDKANISNDVPVLRLTKIKKEKK